MVAATADRPLHLTAALAVCCGAAAVIALPGFTAWLHNLLSDSSRHPLPEGTQAAYGIVLGYALHRNGSCTRPLQSRVEAGVQAYMQGDAGSLIFSGAHPGSAPRHVSEANAMMGYAQTLPQQPVPLGRWLLEEQSTSTRTNAWYSLDIISAQQQQQHSLHQDDTESKQQQQQQQQQQQRQQQQQSVLIVTSPFHQLRSFYTFKRAAAQKGLSIQLYTAHAPFAGHHGYGHWLLDGLMDQLDFWRELAALGWYGLRGWL